MHMMHINTDYERHPMNKFLRLRFICCGECVIYVRVCATYSLEEKIHTERLDSHA